MANPCWTLEVNQIHNPNKNREDLGASGVCLGQCLLSGETERRLARRQAFSQGGIQSRVKEIGIWSQPHPGRRPNVDGF